MLREILIQKGLSHREAEVAEHLVQGLSNKEIGNQLFVTEKTIKFHLTNIYKKLGLKSRSQLIVWAMPHHTFTQPTKGAAAVTSQVVPKAVINEALPTGI